MLRSCKKLKLYMRIRHSHTSGIRAYYSEFQKPCLLASEDSINKTLRRMRVRPRNHLCPATCCLSILHVHWHWTHWSSRPIASIFVGSTQTQPLGWPSHSPWSYRPGTPSHTQESCRFGGLSCHACSPLLPSFSPQVLSQLVALDPSRLQLHPGPPQPQSSRSGANASGMKVRIVSRGIPGACHRSELEPKSPLESVLHKYSDVFSAALR